jgi:hypothetical protein
MRKMHRRPVDLPHPHEFIDDDSAAELLSQTFRNAELIQAVLQRHMRVYLVHKECANSGKVQPHLGSVTNYFSGKKLAFIFNADGSCPTPAEQRAQIARPLKLIRAALFVLMKRSPYNQLPGHALLSAHPAPPVHACSAIHWLPCEIIRVMSGCTVSACHRLMTAPLSFNAYIKRTKRRLEVCVMARIVNGLVFKLQVRNVLFTARVSRLSKCIVRTFDTHYSKLSLCFWSKAPFARQQHAFCPASFCRSVITALCCRRRCSSRDGRTYSPPQHAATST